MSPQLVVLSTALVVHAKRGHLFQFGCVVMVSYQTSAFAFTAYE